MAKIKNILLILLVTGSMMAGLAFFSALPIGSDAEHGLIRLSWRTNEGKIEICRGYTSQELKQIPAHMRQKNFCSVQMIPYRLVFKVNGQTLTDESVMPGGVRADHPLTIQKEYELQPGRWRVSLSFEPQNPEETLKSLNEEQAAAVRQKLEGLTRYRLDQDIEARKGGIIFIDLDVGQKAFQVSL